ncbi:hypothetical protein ATANTOWER_000152 [Ataeniobius toweri]|uniref:Uncharacterized protein n=1 Tax=Ataeniobius toweri TaxID=208326 RepID=A0ABU7BZJ3_9TELE|nr:hypothetical protein [Ataeniobius toweri]
MADLSWNLTCSMVIHCSSFFFPYQLPACYPKLSVQLSVSQVFLWFALGGVPAGKQDLAVTFPFSIHCQDFHFTPNSFFQLWNNANRSQIMELSSAVHIYHCFIK